MLKIKDLKVSLQEKIVFSNVNLELKSSEILIVTGENGSGKTTLLRSIGGLIEPKDGEILCADYDIFEYFDDYLHDYTYISEDSIFNLEFSVKYYLDFWSKFNDTQMLLESTISYFKFANILSYSIGQISSGWRKRLHFAKLLLDNRIIWLLDEPLALLDLNGQDLIINMINSRLLSGGLVILTTNQKVDSFKNARYFDLTAHKNSFSEI